MNRELSKAWLQWKGAWGETRAAVLAMRNSLHLLFNREVSRAWNSWLGRAAHRTASDAGMGAAVSRWRWQAMVHAFRLLKAGWHHAVSREKRKQGELDMLQHLSDMMAEEISAHRGVLHTWHQKDVGSSLPWPAAQPPLSLTRDSEAGMRQEDAQVLGALREARGRLHGLLEASPTRALGLASSALTSPFDHPAVRTAAQPALPEDSEAGMRQEDAQVLGALREARDRLGGLLEVSPTRALTSPFERPAVLSAPPSAPPQSPKSPKSTNPFRREVLAAATPGSAAHGADSTWLRSPLRPHVPKLAYAEAAREAAFIAKAEATAAQLAAACAAVAELAASASPPPRFQSSVPAVAAGALQAQCAHARIPIHPTGVSSPGVSSPGRPGLTYSRAAQVSRAAQDEGAPNGGLSHDQPNRGHVVINPWWAAGAGTPEKPMRVPQTPGSADVDLGALRFM